MLQRIKDIEKQIETKEDYKQAIEVYCGWKVQAIQKRLRGNPDRMVMMMCKPVMDFEMEVLPKVESDPAAYADGVELFLTHMSTVLNNDYRPDMGGKNLMATENEFLLNYIYHGMEE